MKLQRKLVIQMSGAPGSGKSTMAKLLAQSIGGVVINHDLIKSCLLENEVSFDQSSKLTYLLDRTIAEDLIKQGLNIIIDSTCNFIEVLEYGIALAQQYDCDYKYVECSVNTINNIDLLDQRLHNRVPLRSQRKGVNYPPADNIGASHSKDFGALFKEWIENPCRPARGAIVVDSTRSPEECLAYVLKQIVTLTDAN
jgi:predicted kinase